MSDINKTTILGITIAAALIVGTIATGSLIYAQAPPSVGPGAPTHVEVAGFGTVTCADNTVFNNVIVTVTFDIPNTGQEVFLRNENNPSQQHRSILFEGEITENDYILNGIFNFRGGNFICVETPVPVTVSGDCGIGVDITVEATDSMTGEFFGNAACV